MDAAARVARLFLVLLLLVPLGGCELVEGIFKAGVWVGVILAAVVVIGIMWMVRKARG